MRYKLICCEVFSREVYQAILDCDNAVFPVFTTKMSHEYPDFLRETIQQEIDKTDEQAFDCILLGYGLCGNAVVGLKAGRIPLVIPRAHDCCTILLGSKEAFKRYFGHRPSNQWTSGGYMESGEEYLRNSETHQFLGLDMNYRELVEKYGEENAVYIRETLMPKDGSNKQVVFIKTPPYERLNFCKKAESDAEHKGCTFETIDGDMRLLRMLIGGIWPEKEFLTVPEGHRIEGIYDHEIIISAR